MGLSVGGLACAQHGLAPPAIDRLPELGTRTFVCLQNETRPAVLLRSGERRTSRVLLKPGARLRFSVGVLDDGPRDGVLELAIRVGGRLAYTHRFPLRGHAGFWNRDVPIDGSGTTQLEFAVDLLDEQPPAAGRACIALASPRLQAPSHARRRTLIWMSQDALRADHLGTYGYARRTSPHFDAAAAGWTVFENATATSSWTLPSMASQFLSRYPAYHGAVMETQAANETPSLFQSLADAGFTVLGVTASPYISAERSLGNGFDALWSTDGRATEVNALVLRALDLWGGGDLALFAHYIDPHLSYAPPPPYDSMFDDPGYRGHVRGVTNFFLRYPVIDSADTEHLKALYDGEIAFTDTAIHHLLAELERQGLTERAVIAYTADHGEEFRDHGFWTHSRTLYEELVHVPFALRVPGLPPRRISQSVSLVDLAPTLLEALGVSAPPTFQGRSLMPLLNGRAIPNRPVFSETVLTSDRNQIVSVRSSNLKCVVTVPRGREPAPATLREEFYDLAVDPQERASRPDLPQKEPLRRAALAYLADGRRNGRPGPAARLDPEALEKLRAWGYGQ
jgi:arylsulfatase A-like enzyme